MFLVSYFLGVWSKVNDKHCIFFPVAYESGVPVLFEPVSVVKSSRIAPIAEHVSAQKGLSHLA